MRGRKAGAQLVASRPGADAWLSEHFDTNDFFLLQPEPWSYSELEAQWRRCEARAQNLVAHDSENEE